MCLQVPQQEAWWAALTQSHTTTTKNSQNEQPPLAVPEYAMGPAWIRAALTVLACSSHRKATLWTNQELFYTRRSLFIT